MFLRITRVFMNNSKNDVYVRYSDKQELYIYRSFNYVYLATLSSRVYC